jgi:hypothetical protein
MADTTTTVQVIDGLGDERPFQAVADSSGNLAFQTAQRVNGAPVGPTNPLPTSHGTLAYLPQGSILEATTVGGVTTAIVAAGVITRLVTIFNTTTSTSPGAGDPPGTVWITVDGSAAQVGVGAPIYPGGGSFTVDPPPAPGAVINAICDNGTAQISAIGG